MEGQSVSINVSVCAILKENDTKIDSTWIRIGFPGEINFIETPRLNTWTMDELDDAQDGHHQSNWESNVSIVTNEKWIQEFHANPHLLLTESNTENMWNSVLGVDISPLLDGDCSLEFIFGDFDGKNIYAPLPKTSPIHAIRITVTTETPLLSEEQCKYYNPMSVGVARVKSLPGLIIDKASVTNVKLLKELEGSDKFSLLRKYSKPVYLTFDLFPDDMNRTLMTSQFTQGTDKLKLNSKTTILVGLLDRDAVAEVLETKSLQVFVHDRDVDLVTTTMILDQFRNKLKEKYAEAGSNKSNLGELDRDAWREYCSILRLDMQQQACGRGTFSMGELWSNSKELVDRHLTDLYQQTADPFSHKRKIVDIKLTAPVVPVKRNIELGGEVEMQELDLTMQEKLIRLPGRYLDAHTEMQVFMSLTHPLHHHRHSLQRQLVKADAEPVVARHALFERAIFMFPYNRVDILLQLRNIMSKVNSQALGIEGSLSSYQLTDEQREAADSGALDLISGFHIIDDMFRIIVFEGLANGGMNILLRQEYHRDQRNDDQIKILANSNIRFKNRLYTAFDAELKVIRLRDPLSHILQAPEIYNQSKVDIACQQALTLLCDIRSASRMSMLFRTQAFPTAQTLIQLESKYGESVSLMDIRGSEKQRRQSRHGRKNAENSEALVVAEDDLPMVTAKSPKPHRKAATDTRNLAFEEAKEKWQEKDYLTEQSSKSRDMKKQVRQRLEQRSKEDEQLLAQFGKELGTIAMYSTQRNNFKIFQFDEMRKRYNNDTSGSYTYSSQYQSLAFPLVDEGLVERNEAAASRAKFTTARGFKYPAARTSVECRQGNRVVSASRAEELHQPWVENATAPSDLKPNPKGRKNFDCVPTKDNLVFGGYNQDGTKNPQFYKSVFLMDEEAIQEVERKKEREKQEWRDKIIVENLTFRVHQGSQKPSQLDKLDDILDGKPKKAGLRIVHQARLPSGKKVPLKPAPVSIFKAEDSTSSNNPSSR